jgi:hypothetical protein
MTLRSATRPRAPSVAAAASLSRSWSSVLAIRSVTRPGAPPALPPAAGSGAPGDPDDQSEYQECRPPQTHVTTRAG